MPSYRCGTRSSGGGVLLIVDLYYEFEDNTRLHNIWSHLDLVKSFLAVYITLPCIDADAAISGYLCVYVFRGVYFIIVKYVTTHRFRTFVHTYMIF